MLEVRTAKNFSQHWQLADTMSMTICKGTQNIKFDIIKLI